MKKILNNLQLDVLRRHIGPFLFCFLTIMFLLLMQFLILHIEKLVGKGLPLGVIIELVLTNLAYMVVLAAPMAVLVATLMAFGKFSEMNELTALRAAGVNPFKVISPVLTLGVLLCLFLVWFSNDVLPDANHRAHSMWIDIRLKKPGFDLQENQFYKGIDGYTFLVKEAPAESDSLYDVTLFQELRQDEAYIKAKRGYLQSEADRQSMTLFLNDGSIYREFYRSSDNRQVVEETRFDRYRITFDLSSLSFSRSNPDQHSRNDRTMNVQAMAAVVDSLERKIDEERKKVYSQADNYSVEIDSTVLFTEPDQPGYRYRSYRDSDPQPPVQSDYLVLNGMELRGEQNQVQNAALQELRDYQAKIENLHTNVEWRQKRVARYLVEIHKKFSIPFACIIFVLIGAPIGMMTRKGNLGYAALISVGFLTFYWISIIQGEKLADRLFISPFMGMWFSDIVLGIAGLYLTLRICTSFSISKLWKNHV